MATIPVKQSPRAVPNRRRRERRRIDGRTAPLYVLLIILSIIFLVPFYLMVRNALMTNSEISSFDWKWLPIPPHFENWSALFGDISAPMGAGLRNSAIIAVTTVVFQMLFASMAGYALARIPARGRNIVFFLLLATLMIPGAVTFVPLYVLVAFLGGVNTLWGIIVPGLFNVFATFLFRQFYLDFPIEIEEAGRVDGLGYFGIYRYLLIPNSIGILMALGILAFIGSWNSFLWPLVIGRDERAFTVQVVLSTFLTAQTINLGALFMGAVVGVAPLVIVFLFMQRYIVEGVKLTGVKG